jgi:CDP-diacylglycerol--serine O-phosphatidyltransferase
MIEKKRRRRRFDLKKTMFVLPNLFTLSSIFCGFYAIILMSGVEATSTVIKQAATLIVFALLFDGLDGRVARLTKTQSDFGMELDSLADVVSFGVAPGILAYKYGLVHLGSLGVFLAFVFAACGAIRLARFNVLAHRNEGSAGYFLGLPIPLAAGVLVSVMLANNGNPISAAGASSWAALMLVISYLMVSNVRYRTFKKMKSKRNGAMLLLGVGGGFVVLSRLYQPGVALAMVFAAYVSLGLIEAVVFFRARRREVPAAPAPDSVV